MKTQINLCYPCKRFTLKKTCPICNKETSSPKPAKFSPLDKYGEYRRKYKKIILENG